MDPAEIAKMLVALVVMVDPIGVAPIFLALTAKNPDDRKRIARLACITAMIVLTSAAVIGQYVLQLFGISLDSFRVIGGVLFFVMALDMLNARPSRTKRTDEEAEEAKSAKETAIVPLGLPLLAGPGAISSVILSFKGSDTVQDKGTVLAVILITCGLSFGILLAASKIAGKLGRTGIAVLERLMGLILGAIAVEMIAKGLKALLPGMAV